LPYSSIVLWLTFSACLAAALIALFFWKRRQDSIVSELSKEVWQFTRDSAATGRLSTEDRSLVIGDLTSAVNKLLETLEQRGLKLQEREQLFQRLVETVHDAVLVHRQSILFANTRFLGLLGVSAKELIGKPLPDYVAPEYAELVRENLRRRLAGEPAAERYEAELLGPQGQLSRVELATSLIDSAGEPALLVTAVEMLPAPLSAPAPVRPRSMITLDAMGEAVFTVDSEGRIDYVNRAAEVLFGLRPDQLLGRGFTDVASLVDEQDRHSLGDPVRKCLQTGGRVTLGRRAVLVPVHGGSERSIEIGISPLRADSAELAGVVVVMHDASELRGIARQMSYQASHDALTGLINRREFERRLAECMELARAGEAGHALCYLDLDRFKLVNDSVGHMAGDNMLREVAALIKDRVRDSDTVARIGGDEFALLLVGCPLDKARQIADDVVRSIATYRFVWKDKIFDVGASIGLVELGHESGTPEDVMSAADSACYVAKKQGGTHVHVYSAREEATARHSGEIHWLQKLQGALRDNKFELYYQSIVHAQRGGLRGPALEVLIRLNDPTGPEVAPMEFIRAAERYRLMPHIDRWVVQTVLSALGRGGLKLPAGRSVAINIAGQTLGDAHFLEFVVDCFDHTGASPGDVCFEVTESSMLANLEHARRFIEVLHGMGCEFALDNFGSGLGSFSNLKNLPMDYLKIDGSFIRNLAEDAVNQAMVAAMVKMSRSMNFRVVAEHVEDQQCLDAVQSLGIDFVQGFAIGRPQPLSMTPAG
jgi:diguanylate cyclase (GGDEF)-like protein/PAS domain S-box-containing protein